MQKQRAGRNAHHAQNTFERLRKHPLNFPAHKTGSREIHVGKREHVLLNAPLFFFVKAHHHQRRGKELRKQFDDAQGTGDVRTEQKFADQDGAPTEERSREEQVRKRLMPLALLVENPGNGREHRGDAELRRNSNRVHIVCRGPNNECSARRDQRPHPGLGIRVHLSGAEEQQSSRSQEPFVDRRLPRGQRRPWRQGGAEIVQRQQTPTRAPEHQVCLAPQAMHVGEEARRQC